MNKAFSKGTVPISAFTVLIISLILNMAVFLSCYIMLQQQQKAFESFLFEHQNDPIKFNPLLGRLLDKVNHVETQLQIVNDNCTTHQRN